MTEEQWEEELRNEFPALKDAWEQYQTILKLCKAEKPKPITETAFDILEAMRRRRNRNYKRSPQMQRIMDTLKEKKDE